MSSRHSRTIFVGNLPRHVRKSEIDKLFYKYGRILDIEVTKPRPPAHCFVEFEKSHDAEDAIRGRDGYEFGRSRLKVELAYGRWGQSSYSNKRSGYGDDERRGVSGSARCGASHHSNYRVIVRGLPFSASLQELKDHMRKAGDVSFAVLMIRELDYTEFNNLGARSYIRVKQYESSSRGYIRSRSRSPSGGRRRNLSRSASRTMSAESPKKATR